MYGNREKEVLNTHHHSPSSSQTSSFAKVKLFFAEIVSPVLSSQNHQDAALIILMPICWDWCADLRWFGFQQ